MKNLIFPLIAGIFQIVYITLRLPYLNEKIPFWYTKPWGDPQLAHKTNLYILAGLTIIIPFLLTRLLALLKNYCITYINRVVFYTNILVSSFLTYSALRIIKAASTPFPALINPTILQFLLPFATAFFITVLIAPKFIKKMNTLGIVTDPITHSHPGMILQKPSARGGGIIFTVAFIITSLLFVQLHKETLAILIGAVILALLGWLDDYQNTHPKSVYSFLENPILRLVILIIVALIMVVPFGIKSFYISNPLGGIITLIQPISIIFTVIWIVWILNLLSWSNGIDGQYSGIVGIAGIVIGLLALRFSAPQELQINIATMAFILSGASLALVFYTWHPSKIMWGFSATSAGLVIALLSILVSTKVATSITIMIIPFLDALVTIVRRLLQKKNPFKGDRGHLHHLLLDRGWSIKKIAVFYWISTAICGIIGLAASERYALQSVLILGGIVAFGIILVNLQSLTKKNRTQ